jgi:hypothetical protein
MITSTGILKKKIKKKLLDELQIVMALLDHRHRYIYQGHTVIEDHLKKVYFNS